MKPTMIELIMQNPVLKQVALAWPTAVLGGRPYYEKLVLLTGFSPLACLKAAAALRACGAATNFGLHPDLERALIEDKKDETDLQQ